MTRVRAFLEVVALILTIAVCGAMLYVIFGGVSPKATDSGPARVANVQKPAEPVPLDPAPLEGAQIEGSRTAKIAVIEYSDFQCPYCGRFAKDTFPQVEKDYVQSGKVLFAFRQFPLEAIHPYALGAAEAAECAGDQGQFWKMHTLTFADQQHLDGAALRDHAQSVGLNISLFDKCLKSYAADRVRADEEAGKHMLVAGTPTFFFGMVEPDGKVKVKKRLSGAIPLAEFRDVLATLLASGSKPEGARVSE